MDIQIAIKEACNRVCPICLVESTPMGEGELDFDLLREFLSTIDPDKFHDRIIFTGGEPLLHPKIIDLVGYTTGRGITTTVHTSGWDDIGEVKPTREFALRFLNNFHAELNNNKLQIATSFHSYQRTIMPRVKRTVLDVLDFSHLMCLNMRYDPNLIYEDGFDDLTHLFFALMDMLEGIGFKYYCDRSVERSPSFSNSFMCSRIRNRMRRALGLNINIRPHGEIVFYNKAMDMNCLLSIGRIQQLGFAAHNRIGAHSAFLRPCSWEASIPYIHWDGNLYPCCSNVGITRMIPMGKLKPGLTFDEFLNLRNRYFDELRPYLEETREQHPNECMRCVRRKKWG